MTAPALKHPDASLSAPAIRHAQNAVARAVAGAPTLESAARHACAAMHRELLLPDAAHDVADARASVLVRCFTSHPLATLDEARRRHALSMLQARGVAAADMPCLVLLGSSGLVPEWDDPARSRRHRVIPLPAPDALEHMPMFAGALRAFGHDAAALWTRRPLPALEAAAGRRGAFEVYHVAPALGSPQVPDQAGFVRPWGVSCVVGFGGPLRSGELYMMLAFLRCALAADAVRAVRSLALDVTTTFFRFAGDAVLESSAPRR